MKLDMIKMGKRLAESHPLIWAMAWEAIYRLPFLLPHDRSYLALRHFVDDGDGLFLDIGANNGISALSFRRLNTCYAILSIEPNTLHKNKLERVKRMDPKFDYRLMGAASEEGEISFFTPVYHGVTLHTFTSFDREQIRIAVSRSFGPRVARAIRMVECRAPVVPIDALKLSPSIIKIDAEGFDLAVIQGAQHTIDRYRPYMMIEAIHTGTQGFAAFFSGRRYTFLAFDSETCTFRQFDPDLMRDESGSRNCFVVPDEKLEKLPLEK
jgi:FkbM family methyltransferase